MQTTKSIGDLGEKIAKDFLIDLGYSILEQNYRHKRGEIDIICTNDETLIFVEVKFRSSTQFGFPEDVVGDSKIDLIQQTAEHYIETNDWQREIRFDILSIVYFKQKYDIKHFIDCF